jgi:hypothetical protein
MNFMSLVLRILGVIGLVGGAVLVVMAGMQMVPVVEDVVDSKQQIEVTIDSIRDILGDVEIVRQQATVLINDYKRGEIRDPDDFRITAFFRQVEDLNYKSADVKKAVEDEIDSFRQISKTVERQLSSLGTMIVFGVLSMILSGWFFTFGLTISRKEQLID